MGARLLSPCIALIVLGAGAVAQTAPTLDLAPMHQAMRSPSFAEASVSYTTPAYVSLDVPRSVTLLYSSALAAPTGLVQVDATDTSATPPDRMSISLRAASGEVVWLAGGRTENVYRGGAGASRLAASFDARNLSTGMHTYTVVVRSWWGAHYEEAQATVRVPIVDERNSPFGLGWSMPGLQRLHAATDGAFVTEGNGAGLWFAKNVSGEYEAPAGDFSELLADSVAGWVRGYPDGTTVRFDSAGRMVEVADRFGNASSYAYDLTGRLSAITDPVGKQTALAYTGSGALASIQDPGGRIVTTSANANILYRFHDPDGVLSLDAHFAGERLLGYWERGVGRALGDTARWHYDYDALGRLAAVVAPRVSTTDAGRTRPTTRYVSLEAAVLPPNGRGTFIAPADRLVPGQVRVAVTDPRGNTTRMALDRFGGPTRVEEPLGRVTVLDYNPRGQLSRVAAPGGGVTKYLWSDSAGKQMELRSVTDSTVAVAGTTVGATVNYEYGPYHEISHVWGNTPERWIYLNAAGLPDSSRVGSSSSVVTRYEHDSRGRLQSATDPEGHGTYVDYHPADTQNQRTVTTGAASTNNRRGTTYSYDALGRVIKERTSAGDSTLIWYDSIGQVDSTRNALQERTWYERYPTGDLRRVTDAKGQQYTFTYDALGRVVTRQDPRGQSTRYGYDRAGNATSITNRRAQVATSTYDELNRMLSRTAGADTTRWSYGQGAQSDRWAQVSNAVSTDRYDYDASGRLTLETVTRGGATYALSPTHDQDGQRTRLQIAGGWGATRSIGYEYDATKMLSRIVGFSGDTTMLTYDLDLSPVAIALPNGVLLRSSQTSIHEPGGLEFHGALGDTLDVGYRYDERGFVMERDPKRIDSLGVNGMVSTYWSFAYDRAGRLRTGQQWQEPPRTCTLDVDWGEVCTVNDQAAIPAPIDAFVYQYDAVGNPATDSVATGNRVITGGGYSYGYDADGNLTSKTGTGFSQTLVWNALGQLTSVTTNNVTTSFAYDGLGRRVRATTPSGTTHHLWDGDDLLMELNGSGTPVREYTYYPKIDRPHSIRYADSTYYYAQESPNNVLGLIAASKQIVNHYEYAAFGETSVVTEQVPQPLRFAGREWVAEAGLYYFRNRWYDPGMRRFVSEDPIGLAGGINPYVYAQNNPLSFADPLGLAPCPGGTCTGPGGRPIPIPGVTGGGGIIVVNLPGRPRTSGRLTPRATVSMALGMVRIGGSRLADAASNAPHWVAENRQCVAASLTATYASAEDISTFLGIGAVLKGARGARAGIKASRAFDWTLANRLALPQPGQGFTSSTVMRSSGSHASGVFVGTFMASNSGLDYGLSDHVKGFVPGVNMFGAIDDAISLCSS